MQSLSRLGLIGFMALAVAAPASADVIFSDGTFNLGNYSSSPLFATDGTATLAASQCASCGVAGGNGLEFNANFTQAGTKTVAQGFANTTFAYDPSTQGAMSSLMVSVAKNISVNFTFTGLANNFRPMILQNGVYYIATITGPTFNGPGGPGYLTFGTPNLVEGNFVSFDFTTGLSGSANPDFDGGLMLFGLVQLSSIVPGIPVPATVVTQYDNLSFTLHTVSVPEPDAIALFGAALLGIGWLRRREFAKA